MSWKVPRISRRFLVLFALIVGLGACRSGPQLSPSEQAMVNVERAVELGVRRGAATADGQDRYRVRARYNPVACDLPDFEVYAHQGWRRAYLEGQGDIRTRIDRFKDGSAQSYSVGFLEIEGTFSGTRRAQSGARYPIFTVVAVQ